MCVYSVSLCRPQGISLMPQLSHGFAPYNALWRQSLALTPPSASNDCWHTTHSLTALKITFWPKMKFHSLVKCIILRKGELPFRCVCSTCICFIWICNVTEVSKVKSNKQLTSLNSCTRALKRSASAWALEATELLTLSWLWRFTRRPM